LLNFTHKVCLFQAIPSINPSVLQELLQVTDFHPTVICLEIWLDHCSHKEGVSITSPTVLRTSQAQIALQNMHFSALATERIMHNSQPCDSGSNSQKIFVSGMNPMTNSQKV